MPRSEHNNRYANLSSPFCSPLKIQPVKTIQIKSNQNRDILYQKYITKGMSAAQISKEFKCADTTIRRWLKKFGIPIRTNSESKIGGKNHNWKGGETLHEDGHVLVRSPDHPNVNANGYIRRSRLVMEKHLGRYLSPGEIVHHKNEDTSDDLIENLDLFPGTSEHVSFHWEGRRIKARF